jgi:cardiolipin synthase
LIDYSEAFVGGHNVADQYVGRDKWFGHWRDTHVRIEGPAAVACALSFVEDWLWASGESHRGAAGEPSSKCPATKPSL